MDIIRRIQEESGLSDIIKDLIEDHKPIAKKMISAYEKYKGDVPISDRTFTDVNKINNKLANDYRGDIIDEIVGYMFGEPITYLVDDTSYSEAEAKKAREELYHFTLRNNIDDQDSETGKIMSICGYSSRLLYNDMNAKERAMNIPSWECIFVDDGSINESQYALRYYPIEIKQNNNKIETTKVEWYDSKTVSFFILKGDKYVPDTLTEKLPVMPHMFDGVPLIKFKNNEEELGDFDKVETLIDAYDRLLSDVQNEVEEFRLAYMLFYGAEPDEETISKARQSGAFGMPEGSRAEFLTKTIAGEFIESHKKTLNENIYKFSKTVDMSDEKFSGGGQSGESRKWKLLGLENKAVTKERKFTTALRNMFKVLSTSWQTKGINIDYLDIYFEFKRNVPVELSQEAETSSKLKGLISEQTRLGLLSFVDDPEWEMNQIKEDTPIDLDNLNVEGEVIAE